VAVDYALIGHVTADLTPDGRKLGGTVSYAARTAHAFGLKVGLLTSAPADDVLLSEVEPYVSELVNIPADETTTYENVYSTVGRTQYVRATAEPITLKAIPRHFRDAPLVHLAPIAGEYEPGAMLAAFPKARILLTLQGMLRAWGADGRVRFKRWLDAAALKRIDVVVFSEEDILEAPELEREIAAVCRRVVVTRAERGGTVYIDGESWTYSTPQVEVINPTGAGDVFAAGLLAAWHILGDFDRAVPLAAALGATAVTRNLLDGAPTAAEVRSALCMAKGMR
jgi:sugar/nucleoside kinase (ribokinase family)